MDLFGPEARDPGFGHRSSRLEYGHPKSKPEAVGGEEDRGQKVPHVTLSRHINWQFASPLLSQPIIVTLPSFRRTQAIKSTPAVLKQSDVWFTKYDVNDNNSNNSRWTINVIILNRLILLSNVISDYGYI
jgi:hypothetical protein